MPAPGVTSPSCIYACTRFRVRRTTLLPREEYLRLMQMSIPGVIGYLSRREDYKHHILDLAHDFSGAQLIEEAVNHNLAESFRHAMATAPGDLHTLTGEYLNRWDIANVMAILRGTVHDIPRRQIRDLLVPAGELDGTLLDRLLNVTNCGEAIEELQGWRLYPVLAEYYRVCGEKGVFARIEDELYRQYYADLLGLAATGCSGCQELNGYLRFEIDITNMRNLLRLHCAEEACDLATIDRTMISGGRIPIALFRRLYGIETEGEFVNAFLSTDIVPVLAQAVRELRQDPEFSSTDAAELVWQRWHRRRRPVHEVEMAVTRVRLHHLEALSRRHPFSVLPVLAYLERKKYEVANLRAIARGKAFDLAPERIWQYIVL
ncbi:MULTISPECIES: V-type ATP synthase subunit C [Methanoculleus]|uniref:A-type ATP synthase subunit C n=2 Tax=Methanoculleus TaxID=45989 RepID=A3CT25_METMJ|nr:MULTISPECIES: V-type ATP synthase subunit C [Methanoculleus]ABN56525.1 H+-transporting two-sector ATPase, C (AC39) subunit [Methanoculleus marisnigri JR1]MCC7556923.1 V-type ATP synthase subunit C [Methanoculleus marisnigri]UYU17964.1 V-type ATP synthase subunit C [Methanoculleus submarinus]